MTSFFSSILNISFTATIVALAVILLRFLFKKAPRWISCLLWGLVGLRLAVPFSIESEFSLIPNIDMAAVTPPALPNAESYKVYTGITILNDAFNRNITSLPEPQKAVEVMDILAIVWISVAALLIIYGIVSYIMMYLRVSTAIPLKKNIYQSENVKSPFVLGFIKPKIYVPFNLTGKTLKYVLAHEEAHIKRKDHIVKPFAFLLLCFHWFNPLMWLSYILLCRDIEVACDEKVIKSYSINKRKNYAFALLRCKVKNTTVAVCPVAFGEVSVKSRIKNTLSYKKPAMWVVVGACVVSIIASGCLLTNPKAEEYYVETTIKVSNESDANNQSVTLAEQPVTESIIESSIPTETTESTTATPPTEVQTEPETEVYEEYYEEDYYSEEDYYYEEEYYSEDDYYYEEPDFTIPAPSWTPVEPPYEGSNYSYNSFDSFDISHDINCTCADCILSGKPIVWDYNSYYQQQNIYNNSPFNNNNGYNPGPIPIW